MCRAFVHDPRAVHPWDAPAVLTNVPTWRYGRRMSKGVKWLLIVLAVIVLAVVVLILFKTPTKNEMRQSFDSQPRHMAGLVDARAAVEARMQRG